MKGHSNDYWHFPYHQLDFNLLTETQLARATALRRPRTELHGPDWWKLLLSKHGYAALLHGHTESPDAFVHSLSHWVDWLNDREPIPCTLHNVNCIALLATLEMERAKEAALELTRLLIVKLEGTMAGYQAREQAYSTILASYTSFIELSDERNRKIELLEREIEAMRKLVKKSQGKRLTRYNRELNRRQKRLCQLLKERSDPNVQDRLRTAVVQSEAFSRDAKATKTERIRTGELLAETRRRLVENETIYAQSFLSQVK
jgi:hypothetical protein